LDGGQSFCREGDCKNEMFEMLDKDGGKVVSYMSLFKAAARFFRGDGPLTGFSMAVMPKGRACVSSVVRL
jgi:hypothetical protein